MFKAERSWDAQLPNGLTDAQYAEKLRGNPADPDHTYEEIAARFAEFGVKRNDNVIRSYFKKKGLTNPCAAQARKPAAVTYHTSNSRTYRNDTVMSGAPQNIIIHHTNPAERSFANIQFAQARLGQSLFASEADAQMAGTPIGTPGIAASEEEARANGQCSWYGSDSVPLAATDDLSEYDPENDPAHIAELVLEERKKEHARRENRLRNQWIKRQSLIDEFVEGVREAIEPIEYAPYVPHVYTNHITGNQAAVLYLSDAHIGKLTESFNVSVIKDRLEQIVNYVRESVRRQRMTKRVDELHLIFGGDICDGANIFPTQAYHSEQNIKNQIFRSGVPYFAELLRDLATDFERVIVATVPGNHGRQGKFAHEEDNADNYFYHALALSCVNLPNVEWDLCTHWFKQHRVMNTNFLLVHGHQHMSQQGVPYYSITRMAMKWQATMPEHFAVEIMGHFHTPAELEVSGTSVIMNGSMVTGDEYALEKMGAQSAPMQTFLFVDEEHGLVERQLIHLR